MELIHGDIIETNRLIPIILDSGGGGYSPNSSLKYKLIQNCLSFTLILKHGSDPKRSTLTVLLSDASRVLIMNIRFIQYTLLNTLFPNKLPNQQSTRKMMDSVRSIITYAPIVAFFVVQLSGIDPIYQIFVRSMITTVRQWVQPRESALVLPLGRVYESAGV